MTTKKDKKAIQIIGFTVIGISIIALILSVISSYALFGSSIISPYVYLSIMILIFGVIVNILGFALPLTPERQR